MVCRLPASEPTDSYQLMQLKLSKVKLVCVNWTSTDWKQSYSQHLWQD